MCDDYSSYYCDVSPGAIAGGVIGGLCILSLIGVGIWFCCRNKRRDHNAEQLEAANYAQAQMMASQGESIVSCTHPGKQ